MAITNGSEGMAATEATPDQPVRREDRIVSLDFIRGIAVLGILWANITDFGHPQLAYFWPQMLPGGGSRADETMWLAQYVLIDGKIRGLFTLLFGAGVYLFMERAWERGSTRWLQARRLMWLGLFGLAHRFFVWTGDILFLYAMAGLVSLLFLRMKAKSQLILGLVMYCVLGLLFLLPLGGQALIEADPSLAPEASAMLASQVDVSRADAAAEIAAFDSGYGAVVAYHFSKISEMFFLPFLALVETIPLMLIGMALYRRGLFEASGNRSRAVRWAWIGIIMSAIASLLLGLWAMRADFPFSLTSFIFNGAGHYARLPMVLGLATLLALWAPTAARTALGQRFVAAGRAAFTNYLGTSLVLLPVFTVGLALHGELSRVELLAPVLAVWALILLWSKPWLERYRYGPLEWLWRCLTYGRLFPLKR